MKKRLFTIILSLTLAINCISNHAYATEQKNTSSCVKTENLSKYVLQEGGMPAKVCTDDYAATSYKYGNKRFNHFTNENEKNAADLLMATLDSFQKKCSLSKYHISSEQFKSLFPSLLNQNPRYFYLDSGYSWTESNGYVSDVICNYKYSTTVCKTMVSDYNAAIAKALEGINPSWSDLEKALYLNDYLASNCEYDTTFSKYSAYDALVEGKAVCQGYSLAYTELLSYVGIPCKVVGSDSLDHAWNMVFVNGHYYYVDVTWNDPVGNYCGRSGHKYFLKSEDFFRSQEGGHLAADDWYIDDDWKISDANDNFYDNYFWNTIDTGFQYIDGFWYAFDGTGNIKKYSYNNGNFNDVETIAAIDDVWYVTGNPGWFWEEKFVGTGTYNNTFYYSSPDKIYQLDVNTGKYKQIFELSADQKNSGNIWSIYINPDGELYYYWSAEINSAEKKLALQLEKTNNNQTNQISYYQIQFNGNGADSGYMENMDNCLFDQTYQLSKNAFIYNNYEFAGWNTKPDGTGVSYEDNADIRNLTTQNYEIIVLYAQWKPQNTSVPDTDTNINPPSNTEENNTKPSTSTTATKKTKLSCASLKIKKGKTAKLKLLNNTQKVTWKIISGKKYISLKNKSNTGVTIKGIKKGTAKVQALVGNKKYNCTVKIS